MIKSSILAVVIAVAFSIQLCDAFVLPSSPRQPALARISHGSTSARGTYVGQFAKKKKKRSQGGAGFGTVEDGAKETATAKTTMETSTTTTSITVSTAVPSATTAKTESSSSDDTLSPEDRAASILRDKYGMKTIEEQRLDAKQLERVQEQRKRFQELKKQADDSDFDLMAALPAPLLVAIDRVLKIGVGVSGVAFILAGIGITIEAWSTVSGQALPPNVDDFIVNVVEPNFTPGFLVLLGFSVSLGVFSALQLSSAGAQYKEK